MFVKDGMKFIVQTVFIYRLSEEFLGASGLFTSVLGILNIAELGIGSAISFALYKPLAEHDKDQLKALMALYKKAYLAIGCFILVIGLILVPLLPYIVKDSIEGLNIKIIQNVKALSIANVSRKALDSIDTIIISASLVNGFAIIGKYSNYTLIVSFVKKSIY